MEQLKKKMIKLLNHGFIRLVDYMGSDESIELAARQSYDKDPSLRTEKDTEKLLRYLMRNRHTSPFEMAEVVFQVKAPIFVFRQWHRHRTASINEISGRYAQIPSDFYIPEHFNNQAQNNKQGSAPEINSLSEKYKKHSQYSGTLTHINYCEMIQAGISKEQARMHLPLSTFSVMTWKCNLHNLFHFLKLRLHEHAQYEIRVYAEEIFKIIRKLFPISTKAFEDYILNGVTFSALELEALLQGADPEHVVMVFEKENVSKREVEEFKKKLKK